MARIVLIKGQSQYDATRMFADGLSAALRSLGHATAFLDMAVPTWPQTAGEVFQEPTDLVVSFNAVGIDIKVEEGSLYERLGIDFVAILLDHPVYHLERISAAPAGSLILCVDQTHASFVERHFAGVRAAGFLPHAGMEGPLPVRPARDRQFDLVFCGTYTDPETIRAEWGALPAGIRRLFEAVAETLLTREDVALDHAMDSALAAFGLHPAPAQRIALHGELRGVDQYVRAVRRRDCIRELARAGLRLDLFGANWEQAGLGDRASVRLHPPRSFGGALEIMQQSRLVLNVMPAFPNGAHERIFSAMLNGAVAVTDTNGFLATLFSDDHDGVFFRWSQLPGLPGRLAALLADPDRIDAVAARGRTACLGRHDWGDRARRLLDLVEVHGILRSLVQPRDKTGD